MAGAVRRALLGPGPASSARPLLRRLGVSVRRVYGPRECAGLCACAVTPDAPPSTVGRPVDGVEVIRSPDGELWTRGPHVFSGYWARPRATLDAFAWGGWLRTGDVGDVDDEGWWTLTGARRRPARAGSAPAPAPAPHQPSATRQPSRGA